MSGTGTFENRYKVLSPESDGEMRQEVSNSKGKHKRVRRSTGVTSGHRGQLAGQGPSHKGQTVLFPKMNLAQAEGIMWKIKLKS